jgi:hypothetical protein
MNYKNLLQQRKGMGQGAKTTTPTPLIIKLPRTGIDQPFLRDRPRFKDLC